MQSGSRATREDQGAETAAFWFSPFSAFSLSASTKTPKVHSALAFQDASSNRTACPEKEALAPGLPGRRSRPEYDLFLLFVPFPALSRPVKLRTKGWPGSNAPSLGPRVCVQAGTPEP